MIARRSPSSWCRPPRGVGLSREVFLVDLDRLGLSTALGQLIAVTGVSRQSLNLWVKKGLLPARPRVSCGSGAGTTAGGMMRARRW